MAKSTESRRKVEGACGDGDNGHVQRDHPLKVTG